MSERWILSIMSGEQRGGLFPSILRPILAAAELPYATLMRLRNRLYDAGTLAAHRLPISVISVGNITAGGTGKTPVVRWLAAAMSAAGRKPAVLLRGYGKEKGQASDEQTLLCESLPSIPVHVNPDRVAGGKEILDGDPGIDILVLDDAFQHRRVARDVDLVLIDATNPFGFGHVHPRGLLREPLSGLGRADALILTRADQVGEDERKSLEARLRAHNPRAPIYRARHALAGLRSTITPADASPDRPLQSLEGRRFFAAAGIGNPQGLLQQLRSFPGELAGHRLFPDHHPYTAADLQSLFAAAREARADVLIVTEKDWVKLRPHCPADPPIPVLRLALEIDFLAPTTSAGLLDFIEARLEKARLNLM